MRRRIDMHDLFDISSHGEAFCDRYDGVLRLEEPPDLYPVLRDEALWAELVQARLVVSALEARVVAAVVPEPLDDVEREIAPQMWDLLRSRGPRPKDWFEQYEVLRDRLRKHAEEA